MLSFIVPAYNEERFLGATLESIDAAAREAAAAYEIVVADDASTDATASIARSAGARVVAVANRQISKTRNDGARAAAGDRFIFVDADTRVSPAVVRAALVAMDAGAVGGGAMPVFEAAAPAWAHRSMSMATVTMRLLRLAAGCFVFCTREAFEATGGFDERHFAGEEIMFSLALRRRGRFVILPERITTSARKAQSHGPWETLWMMTRLTLRGMSGVRRRESTGFWYDRRG